MTAGCRGAWGVFLACFAAIALACSYTVKIDGVHVRNTTSKDVFVVAEVKGKQKLRIETTLPPGGVLEQREVWYTGSDSLSMTVWERMPWAPRDQVTVPMSDARWIDREPGSSWYRCVIVDRDGRVRLEPAARSLAP